jgi:ribosomal protein L37AE/L43A
MRTQESTILYCNRCRMSTVHAVEPDLYTCRKCGTQKIGHRARRTPACRLPETSERDASGCSMTAWN